MASFASGSRTCRISLENDTDYTASKRNHRCCSGNLYFYADSIKPHETAIVKAESSSYFGKTEGWAEYAVGEETIKLCWDVPYSGSNRYFCRNITKTRYGYQKFSVSYKASGNFNVTIRAKIELSKEERERRQKEQERIRAERLEQQRIEDEKKKKKELAQKAERARIRARLAKEGKLINRLKKQTRQIGDAVANKFEDEKFQQTLQENGEYVVNTLYGWGSYGANVIKDKLQDEEFQETARETAGNALDAVIGWGSFGASSLFNGFKYGMNKYYEYNKAEPEPEASPSPELPQPNTTLNDYSISYIAWRTAPLDNFAKHANGKHSKVYVIFDVKGIETKWVLPQISFAVERHQNGIFIVNKKDMHLNNNKKIKPHACSLEDDDLNEINLRDFLIKCIELDTRYQLNYNDCHCFAKDMWDYIVPKIIAEKPNKWLTSIGTILNSKLPKGEPQKQIRLKDKLDPRTIKDNETAEDVEQNISNILKKWDS